MPRSSADGGATEPENAYFATNPAPPWLPTNLTLTRAFLETHAEIAGRRVALVTSGGTTVPLEEQTVRYIDNFSAGTRGATSAEYFLEHGYAVIFLHRQFSLLPYSRHYSHNTRSFLDYMIEEERVGETNGEINGNTSNDSNTTEQPRGVTVAPEHQAAMVTTLRKYRDAKQRNTLLILSFVTITDYLWSLRGVAKLMQPLGPRALFYLAAAVSDFFVPKDRMVEHKIQSSEEFSGHNAGPPHGSSEGRTRTPAARTEGRRLVIDLEPVPKLLKQLVDGWAPQGMIVSFKLETDPSILVAKSRHALRKYAHHLVIGNLLSTRKWEVVFVSASGERWIHVPRHRRTKSASGVHELVGMASRPSDEHVSHGLDEDAEAIEEQEAEEERMEVEDVNDKVLSGHPAVEIESLMIPELARMHGEHISATNKP